MANLKERNIALVSKDSEGVTTIDYPLTSTEMVEGLEEFVKTHSTSLTLPLPITKGGTGADNAKVARKNLGLATVASSGDYNDLSNKPSIPLKPKAYIVETYRNGTGWYRVWSDGWLEQGGQVVKVTDGNITFSKAFKYIPTIVTSVSKAYNVTLGGFVVNQSVSTTNFSFKTAIWGSIGIIYSGYSADFTWYACGQGA